MPAPRTQQLQHVHERQVAADIEDVWRALTDPDDVQRCHYDNVVESSWMPGEPVRYVDGDGAVTIEGTVVDVDEPHRLVHTFAFTAASTVAGAADDPPSRVTWTMEPGDDGTQVVLVHDGFESATATFRAVEDSWEQVLDGLVGLFDAEGADDED
jgi:uncharacterized protein YndB with AHSA1/START domain